MSKFETLSTAPAPHPRRPLRSIVFTNTAADVQGFTDTQRAQANKELRSHRWHWLRVIVAIGLLIGALAGCVWMLNNI